jgi:NMD protein affecting ribosome stability and mRNA decay
MNRMRNNKNGKPPRKRSHDVGRCRACGRRDELIAHGMCSECLETGRRPTAAVGMEKVEAPVHAGGGRERRNEVWSG